MNDYKKLCRDLIEEYIYQRQYEEVGQDNKTSVKDILNELLDDTQNVFGNLDGSRTCNTYEAEQFINKAGAVFDQDIIELFNDIDPEYHAQTLARGPEIYDVVILELLAPQVISDMLTE